ncbi:MAG TPA: tetratricopeptide repeat protein [Candidatus Binatia bacterium]|nr:tetratricopeptide repeat protein [Candidatus Binatia bacterium]
MKAIRSVASFSLLVFLAGCTSIQVRSDIQRGRQALFLGEPKMALPYFHRAAQIDPNYLINFAPPPITESVWTYNGRAYYGMKQFADARQAFERALGQTEQDHFARLYLGLTLGQDGDRQKGQQEISTALKGFANSLDYIRQYHTDRFFDTTGELRSAVRKQLASLSGGEPNWPEVVANGEWLGLQLEQEMDLAKKLRRLEETRDSNDGKGDDD